MFIYRLFFAPTVYLRFKENLRIFFSSCSIYSSFSKLQYAVRILFTLFFFNFKNIIKYRVIYLFKRQHIKINRKKIKKIKKETVKTTFNTFHWTRRRRRRNATCLSGKQECLSYVNNLVVVIAVLVRYNNKIKPKVLNNNNNYILDVFFILRSDIRQTYNMFNQISTTTFINYNRDSKIKNMKFLFSCKIRKKNKQLVEQQYTYMYGVCIGKIEFIFIYLSQSLI